jgi:uncharacterized repeat protein (TIGR01451 family)
MARKRSLFWVSFSLVGAVGLLLFGLWRQTGLRSTSADLITFDSPIPPIGEPQIELTQKINDETPQVGDAITYTLAYSNANPGTQAFNVRLYDFLPAGFRLIGSEPPADDLGYGMLLFNAPSIGPTTESVEVLVTGRVLEGYEQLLNHALVVADGVTPIHDALLTDVTQPATWLRLVKTGYSAVLTDDALVYTLMCQNVSDVPVDGVSLIDVLPTGLPLVGASPAPDVVTLPVVKWSLGQLEPGERRTVIITTTAPSAPGLITNTALVDARQRVVTQTLFTTEVVTQAAILRVSKTGSAPSVYPDEPLIYTLRYRNAGNEMATAVRLTDTFPAVISVNAADPPTPGLQDDQGVWAIGALNPGENGAIIISTTVRGKGGRVLLNVADISGQPGSYAGHAELETDVRLLLLYLPIVTRNY